MATTDCGNNGEQQRQFVADSGYGKHGVQQRQFVADSDCGEDGLQQSQTVADSNCDNVRLLQTWSVLTDGLSGFVETGPLYCVLSEWAGLIAECGGVYVPCSTVQNTPRRIILKL